jgi:taurine transport system substrate-binding protein
MVVTNRFLLTRLVAFSAGLLMVVGVFTGCGGDDGDDTPGAGAQNDSPVRINLGWIPAQNVPVQLMIDRNLWKEAGIEANVTRFESGAQIFPALQGGSVDVADFSTVAAATALSQGLDLKVVAPLYDISRTNVLLVPQESDLRDAPAEEFRGKRIGAVKASSSYYGLLRWLGENDMTLDDIEYIELEPAAVVPAFLKGDVDAVYAFAPTSAQLIQRGAVEVTNNVEVGAFQTELWVARTEWVEENGEALERLLDAYRRAYELMAGSQGEEVRVQGLISTMGVKEPVAELVAERTTWPSLEEMVSDDSQFSLTSDSLGVKPQLTETGQFMVENGFIESEPDVETAVDPGFAQRVAESSGGAGEE